MDARPLRVLVVEDDPAHAEAIGRALEGSAPVYQVEVVETLAACREVMQASLPDLALVDMNLPDGQAIDLLRDWSAGAPLPLLVMTSFGSEQMAVDVLRAGALDYLVKSKAAFQELRHSVDRALREWRTRQDHRRVREALDHNRIEMEAIYQNAPVMMCRLDPGFQIIDTNRAFEAYTGRSDAILRSLGFGNALGCVQAMAELQGCGSGLACSQCAVQQAARRILETGQAETSLSYRTTVHQQGVLREAAFRASLALVQAAGRTMFLLCLEDETEREQAKVALRESQTLFESVANSSPAMIWLTGPNKRLSWFNERFLTFVGLGRDHLLRSGLQAVVHPEDLLRCARTYLAAWETYQPFRTEYRLRRHDGAFRWVIDEGHPRHDSSGAFVGYIGSCLDITDHREWETTRLELERRLLHAQKLESLGVMAGGIAHDFNNLLMAMLANLELALHVQAGDSPARAFLERSLQANRRATDLVRQMLAFSGRGTFDVKDLDLNEVVEENVHLFRVGLSRTITLNLNLTAGLPNTHADPGQVQQVVMNLITNASEAIGTQPGTVSISTGVLEADEAYLAGSLLDEKAAPGRYVFVEVDDTGAGMDQDTLGRLFDPFFTTKFTGRGLGMSAVLGIVRGHHGALRIETSPGQGTNVRILFPVSPSPDPAPAAPIQVLANAEAPGGDPRDSRLVLIVDDDDLVRDATAAMLAYLGFRTLLAADGTEAIALFLEHAKEIDWVLLDLTMPTLSGAETFRALRDLHPGIRVVLISGYSQQDATWQFGDQVPSGFLQKPFELPALQALIQEIEPRLV